MSRRQGRLVIRSLNQDRDFRGLGDTAARVRVLPSSDSRSSEQGLQPRHRQKRTQAWQTSKIGDSTLIEVELRLPPVKSFFKLSGTISVLGILLSNACSP